jgi:acid phosphatase (class A)
MEPLKHPLDNIVYEKQKSPEKIHEYVTMDWENILPSPPSNSSQETQTELASVYEIANCREPHKWEDIIKQVDTKTWSVFDEALKHNLSAKKRKDLEKMVNKAWPIVWSVSLSLKRKFNRARPEQLRSDINVMTTKSHQTPAYPSGHAAYGYISAKVISLVYPSLKETSEKTAKLVAFARVVQGVHYPSDGEASRLLVDRLWEDIGFKLFPEYYKPSTWIEREWRKNEKPKI